MGKAIFNRELAATVLLEAIYVNDQEVADKYGISLRSIRNYRRRLATDDILASLFHTKKSILEAGWAESVKPALKASIEFLQEVAIRAKADQSSHRNPLLIQSVAGAMKLLAEVHYTGKIIDARVAAINRTPDDLPRSVPTETGKEPTYTN